MTSRSVFRILKVSTLAVVLTSCGKDAGIPLAATTKAEQADAAALFNGSVKAEAAGRQKKALAGYRKVAKDFPLSTSAAEARFREGAILEKQGELLDAFDAYDQLLSKYPGSARYATAIQRQEAIAHAVAKGHITNNFIGFKTRIDSTRTTKLLAKVRENAPRSPSASKAQFTIGEVWERTKQPVKAIAAYRSLTRDYPNSSEAPEAQFRIGSLLASRLKNGNPDPANIDRARDAFDDLLLRYPNSVQSKKARQEIDRLSAGDIQRSYDLAEFYRKKGQRTSAIFYYGEVVRRSQPGALRSQAEAWIQKLGSQ